ncbi:hypothetical protein BAC3_01000 [uncultured bacterium]|nr:hypothetical protein BAC3_01000 [uncultured bacterium]
MRSALGDLLGEDYSLAQKDKPYRCLDLLPEHRDELFGFLKGQRGKLFGAKYDVLLYDLTSTYFESDPPPAGSDSKKRFGYSRDKRSDCVQVVVALGIDAGRISRGLRSISRQYKRRCDTGGVSRSDRKAVWEISAHLAHGSRYSNGGYVGKDAFTRD